jgi:hypothetical protein
MKELHSVFEISSEDASMQEKYEQSILALWMNFAQIERPLEYYLPMLDLKCDAYCHQII